MGKLPIYVTRNTDYKKSQKQEDRLAKKLGGRKQTGSGSKKFNQGDVRMPEMLTEAKRTDKKSISIKVEYLRKITEEALAYDCVPAVAIEFGDTPKLVDRDWVLIPSAFLRELLDAYRERTEED